MRKDVLCHKTQAGGFLALLQSPFCSGPLWSCKPSKTPNMWVGTLFPDAENAASRWLRVTSHHASFSLVGSIRDGDIPSFLKPLGNQSLVIRSLMPDR